MKLKTLGLAPVCLAALALLLYSPPPATRAAALEDGYNEEETKRVILEYFTARAAGQKIGPLFCMQAEGFEIPVPEHYTFVAIECDAYECRARVMVRQTIWVFAVRIRADRSCIQTLTHE